MKTKKKIKIILAAIVLVFPVLGIGQAAQAASCEWVKQTLNTGNPAAGPEGGCSPQENERCMQASPCNLDARPAKYHLDQGTRISTTYMCCPIEAGELPDLPAPKFELPQLQISIPGADGKNFEFSQVECTTDDGEKYECAIPWIGEYIKAIYNYGFSIAGILAAIVLMAGGVLWIVSGGDAGKVTQAKELITGSVVGLIILAASYILLLQINPDLVKFRPITIGAIGDRQVNSLMRAKNSTKAQTAETAGCATDQELESGAQFYATGYCKPTWHDTKKFYCLVAMDCSCPSGRDTSQNCDEFFPNHKNYAPCLPFGKDVPYCNSTASGQPPRVNTIAAPVSRPKDKRCDNLKFGDQVCFTNNNGVSQTYTITDVGGSIRGKRIDIWVDDCADAKEVTGSGMLTKGPCSS